MAEYMRADCNWTVKLPDSISFEAAAPLMCAGSTIYNSILRAKKPKCSVIAIVGIGGLGYIGVQFAKAMVGTRDWFLYYCIEDKHTLDLGVQGRRR